MNIVYTIERRSDGEELDATFACTITDEVRGNTSGCNDRCYPGEPAECEITAVTVGGVTQSLDAALALYVIDEDAVRECAFEERGDDDGEPDYDDAMDNDFDRNEGMSCDE